MAPLLRLGSYGPHSDLDDLTLVKMVVAGEKPCCSLPNLHPDEAKTDEAVSLAVVSDLAIAIVPPVSVELGPGLTFDVPARYHICRTAALLLYLSEWVGAKEGFAKWAVMGKLYGYTDEEVLEFVRRFD